MFSTTSRPFRTTALAVTAFALLLCGSEAGLGQDADSVLLLSEFTVTVEYTDGHGTADGVPITMSTVSSDDTGAFRFRDPRDTEVLVKMADGCALNGHFWFFSASLTDLAYTIRVVQTTGGAEQTYTNPPGSRAGYADVTSFPCPTSRGLSSESVDLVSGSGPANDFGLDEPPSRGFFCFPDTDTACLFGTNFPVEVAYTSVLGSGDAFAHDPNLSERTALFGLVADDVAEVAIKLKNSCSHYEVHWAQLGNVTLDITVTSFLSGFVWNSPSTTTNGVDREAFVIDADCIFSGSFEIGGPWEWSSSNP